MKILDLYIIKKFLVTYFFVVVMLMLVISVIDVTEKLDDFMKHDISAWFILKEYYFAFIQSDYHFYSHYFCNRQSGRTHRNYSDAQ